MKKILTLHLIILGALLFAVPAFGATTASLSPATIATVPGQTLTMTISVNPQGTPNFAEKIEVVYPAEILEVTSFAFAGNWMALTQPGYDVTDNVKGTLVKTAGYPSGFTASAPFGTISFRAKKAGSGVIKIGTNSLAFEAESQTAITGTGASVAVTAPAVAPVTPPVAPVTPKTPSPKKVVTPETVAPLQAEPMKETVPVTSVETKLDATAQSAAVTSATETGGVPWKWIISGLIVLILIGYGVFTLGRSGRR